MDVLLSLVEQVCWDDNLQELLLTELDPGDQVNHTLHVLQDIAHAVVLHQDNIYIQYIYIGDQVNHTLHVLQDIAHAVVLHQDNTYIYI